MTYINKEIQRKLNIYSRNNQEYIKCLIRKIEFAINGRPEELVRQLFIYNLINETNLLQDAIAVKVEANNHDIEIYKQQKNNNFKPHQVPVVIVEVKREDVNLHNHYAQIKRYLIRACCNVGILYNYRNIILFYKKGDDFEINYLKTFKDIEELVLKQINTIDRNLIEFEQAQRGNFQSFIYLVTKYGKYTTNRIAFKLKNQQAEIKGYFFNVKDNKVYYDLCGQYNTKQQSFEQKDFDKLISITY